MTCIKICNFKPNKQPINAFLQSTSGSTTKLSLSYSSIRFSVFQSLILLQLSLSASQFFLRLLASAIFCRNSSLVITTQSGNLNSAHKNMSSWRTPLGKTTAGHGGRGWIAGHVAEQHWAVPRFNLYLNIHKPQPNGTTNFDQISKEKSSYTDPCRLTAFKIVWFLKVKINCFFFHLACVKQKRIFLATHFISFALKK